MSAFDKVIDDLFTELDLLQPPNDNDEIHVQLLKAKGALDEAYAYPYQYYSKARDVIRARYGDTSISLFAKQIISMSSKQMASAQTKAAARVMERNTRQTILLRSFVNARVDWLKSNGLIVDKVMLLMLASGARRCEILGTGRSEFEAVDLYHIKQTGLAKKTDHTQVNHIVKPLLFLSSDEFVSLLAELRAETADTPLDGNRLISTFDNRLEILSRLCWPQFVSNGCPIGTHVCRSLYVSMAYQLYPVPGMSMNAFAVRVLGHEGFMQVPNYLHSHVTFHNNGPIHDEAVRQYAECADRLLPHTLVDEHGNEHDILPVPRRRLTRAEREQLRTNRINDLEHRHIPVTKSYLRLLNIE